jgi:hypothetical protein
LAARASPAASNDEMTAIATNIIRSPVDAMREG